MHGNGKKQTRNIHKGFAQLNVTGEKLKFTLVVLQQCTTHEIKMSVSIDLCNLHNL